MNSLQQDIRFALRMLLKHKGFTAVASLACYLPARRAAKLDPMNALARST